MQTRSTRPAEGTRPSGGVARYSGPVPILTTAEAACILPLLEGRPELAAIARRLEAAVGADPVWKVPHP